jgi:outer membrane receptor protein involved in Fe transport
VGNVKGGSIVLHHVVKKTFKSALLAGTAAAAAMAVTAVPAIAQDGEKVEKVTVTGSRIKQRDFKSISPIATVGAKEIALTGTVNTEELLNTLPQVIPGVTITSNNPSLNGFATADLRGLGAGRTLVLINGRRANPSSAGGAVDLNTIPASLIERIEVISGGASAVYGADAVAGAINFILKDDFEGFEIGGGYGQAEDGLAPYWVADALVGGQFDGDRGSIALGLQYYNRTPALATERSWSRYAGPVLFNGTDTLVSFSTADLNAGYFNIFSGGSATAPWASIGGFSSANVNSVWLSQPGAVALDNDCNPANGTQATGGTIRFRAGGGIAPFQSCAHPNFTGGNVDSDGDRYNFAPDNYLILGNERVNASAFAKYDILPNGEMEAFIDALFTNTRSEQQLAATPATGLQVKWDIDPAVGNVVVNPYIAAQPSLLSLGQLQFGGVIGNSSGLDNRLFTMNIRTTQVGNRIGRYETNAFGTTQGLRGTMPSIDWDWELFHSYARNSTTVENDNNIGRTAFTQLLNACNTTSTASQAAPLGSVPGCVFPYNSAAGTAFTPTATANNPLGFFALSPAMIEFIRINSTDIITYERTMVSGNATGDVADLWGEGMITAAVGFEYRAEELNNRTDPAKGSGDIIGFNAAESISGSFDVYEFYGEVQVPLITGETLFENLSVTGGYRKSDYSTGAGITETWKYGAEWSPFSWLSFRAVENHAVRAPSAFELFRNGDQNFPSYADPCDKDVPGGPNVPACTAWFAQAGVVYPGAFDQPNSQVQAFLFGNPNLTPEVADTLTYGVVFNPDWWPVGTLGVSVDRYEIELDNQIGQRSISQILNGCRDAIVANGNVYPVGNEFCDAVSRDPLATAAGAVGAIDQSLANFAGVSLYSGIDVNLKWSWALEEDLGLPGTFGINSLYTWVDEAGGAQGLYVGSVGGITAEHKAATSFTYDVDDWSFLVRWNYFSSTLDDVFQVPTVIPAYNYYDFGARWSVTSDIDFSFGIDNVTDEQPFVWDGANAAGQFNTDGSTFDQLGRSYRVGLRWRR